MNVVRNIKNVWFALLAFVAMSMATSPAFAQAAGTVDVSATTTELGAVKGAVLAIGIAVLSIVVGIKLYKWIKSAL